MKALLYELDRLSCLKGSEYSAVVECGQSPNTGKKEGRRRGVCGGGGVSLLSMLVHKISSVLSWKFYGNIL